MPRAQLHTFPEPLSPGGVGGVVSPAACNFNNTLDQFHARWSFKTITLETQRDVQKVGCPANTFTNDCSLSSTHQAPRVSLVSSDGIKAFFYEANF